MTQNYNKKWDDTSQIRHISSEFITLHALDNINGRLKGLVTLEEIQDKVDKYTPQLLKMTDYEQVMLVIKDLKCHIKRGTYNGNLIVACIDSRTMTVKTVMLRNTYQMGQKVSK